MAGRGRAGDLHRRIAVVAVELGQADDPFRLRDLAQEDNVAGAVSDRQLEQILGRLAQVRVGLRSGWYSYKRDTGPSVLPDLDWTGDSTVRVGFVWDTRDIVGLPTRGTFINARYAHGGGWLGGDRDYDLAEGVITKVVPILRGDGVQLLLGGGKDLSGELPATEQFQLGGIRTFPGLQRGELPRGFAQVTGQAQARQVPDARLAFVRGDGGILSAHCSLVLGGTGRAAPAA